MVKAKPIDEATAQSLRDNLRYDPDTGEFWWIKGVGLIEN